MTYLFQLYALVVFGGLALALGAILIITIFVYVHSAASACLSHVRSHWHLASLGHGRAR